MKVVLIAILSLVLLTGVAYAISDDAENLCVNQYLTTTGTWKDMGSEIACKGWDDLVIAVDMSINNATDVSFRAVGKTSRGNFYEYVYPIKDVKQTKTEIDQHLYELVDDTDQRFLLSWDLEGMPWVQIQGKNTYSSGYAARVTALYWRKRDN